MGVYHFMGLGRSAGAVTAAISYLADRYERWSEADSSFFATSGEMEQPGKRGDVQALVLFTSREVIEGKKEGYCFDYIDNPTGRVTSRIEFGRQPMQQMLARILPADLKRLSGGRPQVSVYWCEVDRMDSFSTFERAARVMHAARQAGKYGKEVWINLTGGTNVINLALQLSAALLNPPARLYYLQSADERCVRHTVPKHDLATVRDRFWVEMPVVYLELDRMARAILEELEAEGKPMRDGELLKRLKGHLHLWQDFQSVEIKTLQRRLLRMAGQQLVVPVDEHVVTVGRQWGVLQGYYSVVAQIVGQTGDVSNNLADLTKRSDWIRETTIAL